MLFRVSTESPVPIYEQIVEQITFAVAAGDVAPGDLIPSLRDLARRLLVHPNTVARAFGELERQGVVALRRGRGMEVTADGPGLCQERRRDIVRARLRAALGEAVASRLPAGEVRKLVREELEQINGRPRKGEG